MLWIMAWRNIWRNPRRTGVITTAVVIGVWTMICLSALMAGMMEEMLNNAISTMTGHIQIHAKGYRADPVVENSIADPAPVEAALDRLLPPGSRWAPRIRVNAVVNNARNSNGITLVGIDPEREAGVSFLKKAMAEGRYLEPGDRYGMVVGEKLLEDMETRLGHKLVVMSQALDKDIASAAFRIDGVYRAEQSSTEKAFAFVSRRAAAAMLKMGGAVSELAIMLPGRELVESTVQTLKENLPEGLEVLNWRELLPLMDIYQTMWGTYNFIWYLVIFTAMSFGIVNTTLMVVMERMREFGLMKSLGLSPWGVLSLVLTESGLILAMGTILGNILALITVWLVGRTGIDLSSLAAGLEMFGMTRVLYPVLDPWEMVRANAVVLGLGLVVSLYPAWRAARLTPVEALTHV